MSIKKENKRIMLTLSCDDLDKLKVIMFNLKTRQPSKAIRFLIDLYGKYEH